MRAVCADFWRDIKASARRFSEFTKCHTGVIAVLTLALIFLYGQEIFYYDISIDSEIALSSQAEILNSWVAIDRFGLVLTKKLFGLTRFVPAASNLLMVLTLGFSAFFFDFCIQEWKDQEQSYKLFYYIFPVAYVSAPCLAEQFYFSLQSFEIAWAGFLCILAVYCVSRRIIFRESMLWILPGIFMMIWAFGSYQAFVSLFITVTLISFLICYQNHRIEFQKSWGWFFCGFKYIAVFAVGFIAYGLTSKLVRIYYHLDSSYVDNMFGWKTVGISAALNNIKGDAERIYRAVWSTFFPKLFLPILILCLILLIFRGWRMHRKGFLMYLIAAGLLALSPLFLTIISGSYQPIRGQIVFPFVYAFCLAAITTFQKKAISYLCCIGAALASLHQGQIMTQLFHTSYMTYEQDKSLAASLYESIEQTGTDAGLDTYTVVFVGNRSANLPQDSLRGDVIGHSFFEWDATGYAGSTNRIIGFCDTLGYDMTVPTEEQAQRANQLAPEMPVWPASGSVRAADEIIVIRLSSCMT